MMKIVQVSTEDRNGGAVRVALYLYREYKRQGHDCKLFVGKKNTDLPDVFELSDEGRWKNFWRRVEEKSGSRYIKRIAGFLANPVAKLAELLGFEKFDFPASRRLFHVDADIFQLHVLHGFWLPRGGYFDIRVIPRLSKNAPVVLTVHDMWLFTGHCSHSLGCEKWQTGCGGCPDISLPPAIKRDMSHLNWLLKKKLWERSVFWVACPSSWMESMVKKSILMKGAVEVRVIPNGIDTRVFRPASEEEKRFLRRKLGLPSDKTVVLVSGKHLVSNRWKGFDVLLDALKISGEKFFVVALGGRVEGEKPSTVFVGNSKVLLFPFSNEQKLVRDFICASDIYCLPSRAETHPLSLLEAIACCVPCVASDVGGVPDIIWNMQNGLLFESENPFDLSVKLEMLAKNGELRRRIARNCERIRSSLDFRAQAQKYLSWFHKITEEFQKLKKL